MTFLEQAAQDPGLRAFVDAEIARAGIDVRTVKLESEHKDRVIAEQKLRIAELEASARTRGKK